MDPRSSGSKMDTAWLGQCPEVNPFHALGLLFWFRHDDGPSLRAFSARQLYLFIAIDGVTKFAFAELHDLATISFGPFCTPLALRASVREVAPACRVTKANESNDSVHL